VRAVWRALPAPRVLRPLARPPRVALLLAVEEPAVEQQAAARAAEVEPSARRLSPPSSLE
jgi:hypothetical protein